MAALSEGANMTQKILLGDEKISKYKVILSGVPVSLLLYFFG